MKLIDKIKLKLAKWFAPKGFQVLTTVNPITYTKEELNYRKEWKQRFPKEHPILLKPIEYSVFSGSDTKVFINGDELKNVEYVDLDGENSCISFCIFGQKTVDYIHSLLAKEGVLLLKAANESGNKFEIAFKVYFNENMTFCIGKDTSVINMDLCFRIISQEGSE